MDFIGEEAETPGNSKEVHMKAGIFFTGTGPILLLTTFESFEDPTLVSKLAAKGIIKYIAYEIDINKVRQRYGQQYEIVLGDLKQSDDLRVLDYDGHHVFHKFSLNELGEATIRDAG
jgi:hypothetical protein